MSLHAFFDDIRSFQNDLTKVKARMQREAVSLPQYRDIVATQVQVYIFQIHLYHVIDRVSDRFIVQKQVYKFEDKKDFAVVINCQQVSFSSTSYRLQIQETLVPMVSN